KQIFSIPLTIIKFEVDSNIMYVSLHLYKKAKLVIELHYFAQKNHCWSLHKFHCLAGWCKWSFNISALLKLGFSVLCNKI
ncbi:hypothetical protein BDR06DRAFT_876143, partial [Suillus hirtellus]